MTIKVRIPTPLMKLTDNQSEVSAEGGTISDIINNLESRFNGIKDRICEESGTPRRFINIYINEEDIRFLEGENTVGNEKNNNKNIRKRRGEITR